MKFSTETLLAYADGELDAEMRAAIAAAIAEDPEVAAAVAMQVAQRQDEQLGAGDSPSPEPVPDRVVEAVREKIENSGAPLAAVDTASASTGTGERTRWSPSHWSAIAATLVLGVIIGRLAFPEDTDMFVTNQGRMTAQRELDAALMTQHGGAFDRETGIRVGVSYVAKSGNYCRTFTVNKENMLAGLACRREETWRIDALTRSNANGSGTYRMVNAEVPALILGIVENTISGDPLDADQEAEARENGWRR